MTDPVQGYGVAGAPTPAKKRNRAWIWYFVILAVLTVLASGTLIAFNLAQQLKPEQLAAARTLWEKKGPATYVLLFRRNVQHQGETFSEEFVVRVRDRRVESLTLNGRDLEERLRPQYAMPALFDWIEDFLEKDAKPGADRTFARARFDPADGHLLEYVRRVMGKSERVEIRVERFEALP